MSDTTTTTTTTDEITVEIPEIGENIILPDFKPLPDTSNISMHYVSAFNTGMNIYQCLNYLQGYTEITYEGLVQLIKDLKAYKKALEEYIDAVKKEIDEKLAEQQKQIDSNTAGVQELKDGKVDRVGDTMTGTLNFNQEVYPNGLYIKQPSITFEQSASAQGTTSEPGCGHIQGIKGTEKYQFCLPDLSNGAYIKATRTSNDLMRSEVSAKCSELVLKNYNSGNMSYIDLYNGSSTMHGGTTANDVIYTANNGGISMTAPKQQRPLFNSKPIALLEDITSSGGGVSVTTLWSGSYPATLSTSSTVTVKGFSVARETADIFIFVLQTGDTLFEKYHDVVVYNDKHSTRSEFHGTILNGPYAPNSDSPDSYYKEEAIFSAVCQSLDELTYYAGIRKETQSIDTSTGVLTTTVTGTEGANLVAVKCIELNNTASTTALAAEVVSEYDEAVSEFETKLNERPDTEGPTVDIEPEEQPDEILSESDSTSVSESLSSSESQSESLSSSESQSESLSSSESQSESLSSSESQSESLSSSESQSESLVPPVDYGTQEPTV